MALASATIDDEPFTEEDRTASDAGWDDYLRGESSPLEDFLGRAAHNSSQDRRTEV
jgi:hypothetical protein